MNQPIVWTIAGVDPAGLAGIHADLETLKNLGVKAAAITTAITAQNAHAITAIEAISCEHVAAQCAALQATSMPDAIKIGMTGTTATIDTLTEYLKNYAGFVVLDPVLISSSGTPLIFADMKQHIQHLLQMLVYVDVLTPNLMEAQQILNRSITSYAHMEEAAHELLALGVKSVLLKGGHFEDTLLSQDYWTNGIESFWLSSQRAPAKNYRGTGCMLSSALAACLALGYSIKDALVIAKMYVNGGIRKALALDADTAQLFHGSWPEDQNDLPYVSLSPLLQVPLNFKPCKTGFYPLVDSSEWLEKLAVHGVRCMQLRIKNLADDLLQQEIKRSCALAKKYAVTLFINDYWELAIRYGADGVHLGQEDLQQADLETIYKSGLYLGISTHCYYEVARAHAHHPSYIACGPIFFTTSKIMPFQPQGLEQLARWRRTLSYPLVAIGGINLERMPAVLQTGVEGVALISAISKAKDPLAMTHEFLTAFNECTYA